MLLTYFGFGFHNENTCTLPLVPPLAEGNKQVTNGKGLTVHFL